MALAPFFTLRLAAGIVKKDLASFSAANLIVGPSTVAFTAQYIKTTFTQWASEHWQLRVYMFKYLASVQMAAIELAATVPGYTTEDLETAAAEYVAIINNWVAAAAADQKAFYEVLAVYMLNLAPAKLGGGRAKLRETYSEEQLLFFLDSRPYAPVNGVYVTDEQRAAVAKIKEFDMAPSGSGTPGGCYIVPTREVSYIDTGVYETKYAEGTGSLYDDLLGLGVTQIELDTMWPIPTRETPPTMAQIIDLNKRRWMGAGYGIYSMRNGTRQVVGLTWPFTGLSMTDLVGMQAFPLKILPFSKYADLQADLSKLAGWHAYYGTISWEQGTDFPSASGDYEGMLASSLASHISYAMASLHNRIKQDTEYAAWTSSLKVLAHYSSTPWTVDTSGMYTYDWQVLGSPVFTPGVVTYTYPSMEGLYSKTLKVSGNAESAGAFTVMTEEMATEIKAAYREAEIGARQMEMAIDEWWNDISGSTIDYWKVVSQGHMKTLIHDASVELIKRIPSAVAHIVVNGLLLAATVRFAPVAATVGTLEVSVALARQAVASAAAESVALSVAEAELVIVEARLATAMAAVGTGGGMVTSAGYHLFVNICAANLVSVSGLDVVIDSIASRISSVYAGSWLDNVVDAALPDDPFQTMPDWVTSAMVRRMVQKQSKNEYVEFANGTYAFYNYATQETSYGWVEDYKALYKKTHPEMDIPLFTDPTGSSGTNTKTGEPEIPVPPLPSIPVPAVFRGASAPSWVQQYCQEWTIV